MVAGEAPNRYIALTHSGVTLALALGQPADREICDGTPADAAPESDRP